MRTPKLNTAPQKATLSQAELTALFAQALAMVQNRHRAAMLGYKEILYPLNDSYKRLIEAQSRHNAHPNAGGPAMRLAQAVWDMDYRRRYPHDKNIVMAEENSAAHAYFYYHELRDGKFNMSRAFQAYATFRTDLFKLPHLPKADQPPPDQTPTDLCRALLAADKCLFNANLPRLVREDRLAHRLIHAASRANPEPEEPVMALTLAIPDYIDYLVWKDAASQQKAYTHFETLKAVQYKHRIYLQHRAEDLNQAISALCYQIQPVSQS